MAEAIVSIALARLSAILREPIAGEINLVRGVGKEIRRLSYKLEALRVVLDDAERKGYKDRSKQHWLKKLEDISYDVDDVLDEWNFEILKLRIEGLEDFVTPRLKVCSCLYFKKLDIRRDIAGKIRGINERLDMIVRERESFQFMFEQRVECQPSERLPSTSTFVKPEIHGREADRDVLVSKLMLEGRDNVEELGPNVISIVGPGGVGKSTLARLAYHDDKVIKHFKLRIWILVSDVFNVVAIAKGIVEKVKGSSSDVNVLEAPLKCVTDCLLGERFLLVLDNVWTEDYTQWEPLKRTLRCGGLGSKILVTTRIKRVARMMGSTEIHRLGQLSDEDCWLLIRQMAFCKGKRENQMELEHSGLNIANKCKGSPLAAKVLGSLLCCKDTVRGWKNVLDCELWQLEEVEVDLFPKLLLSYNALSPTMKRCFSYCAIFPKDSEIDVEKLIRMWLALGYMSTIEWRRDMELSGQNYIDNLRMRSFFEYCDGVTCKMHDIIHDFARFLRKNTSQEPEDLDGRLEARKKGSGQACDPSLISQVKAYRSFFCPPELPPHLFGFMKCLRVLSLCECGLREIPEYIESLIHLRYLDLSGNKEIGKVPQTIWKLYYLQTLYLSDCGLNEIPRDIGNLIHTWTWR